MEHTSVACAAKRLQLNWGEAKESAPLVLHSDREMLKRSLSLILDNALKFTSHGQISCSYTRSDAGLVFSIQDTGIGIAEAKTEMIFEMFSQEDPSLTRGYEGSGLGLSIAHGMVKLLGGKVGVSSELGQGSLFTLTLPPEVIVEQPSTRLETNSAEVVTGELLVLITEDDLLNYHYMEILVANAGHRSLHATNGNMAVELCRQHPEISLVLMDIKMPQMNGLEATRLIREFRPNLPIIATTAYALTGDENRMLSAGCNAYLSKPIRPEALTALMQELVGKRIPKKE
jgi:CheY-like chemotaxis protein